MKNISRVLPYLIFASLMSTCGIYSVHNRWGGDDSDEVKKVDVKSIRQNPGSFRSHYLPYFIYVGGK